MLWVVYWVFKLIRGKEGMGYGDFKLLAALGAWLGWQMLPLIVLLSSVVGCGDRHRARRFQGTRPQHSARIRPLSCDRRGVMAYFSASRSSRSTFRADVVATSSGITGGIGSGKSEVAKAFSSLGSRLLDADAVAHAFEPTQAGHRCHHRCIRFSESSYRRATSTARSCAAAHFPTSRRGARLEALLHPLIRGAHRSAKSAAWRGPYGVARRTAADGAWPGEPSG